MPLPPHDPRWRTSDDGALHTADLKVGPAGGLVEQGAMMYRRGPPEARDLVVRIGCQGRELGTTIALETLLDWMPEAELRAAVARRERVTPVLDRLGSRGGTFRKNLLLALADGPMSNEALRARFPEIRDTVLHAALHELKQRGFIRQDPARYRLVPDAKPVPTRLAPLTGRYRATREPLKVEDLPAHLRDQLGKVSDPDIAAELGLPRLDVRELRRSLGIPPVPRGSYRRAPRA